MNENILNPKTNDSRPLILIVDDEPNNITLLVAALGDAYHIKAATSGRKALDIAKQNPKPDLILLDIMMPEMDGYQVCQILKNDPETANINIIFVTAKTGHLDEIQGLKLGAIDYIFKPYRIESVSSRVHNHINRKIQTEQTLLKSCNQCKENLSDLTREEVDKIKKEYAEVNTTLHVLLKHQKTDRHEAQSEFFSRVEETIFPFMERLKKMNIDKNQRSLVDVIENNLQHLMKSYGDIDNLPSAYKQLTPIEMQVASMIRRGLSTKHIAQVLNLAPGTISIHRKHIRKKLGIEDKSDNLYSHLTSLK